VAAEKPKRSANWSIVAWASGLGVFVTTSIVPSGPLGLRAGRTPPNPVAATQGCLDPSRS
jgi:hypothetical protein